MSTLKIVNNNTVNESFVKANKHLLDTRSINCFDDLQLAWKEEFDCCLTKDHKIVFDSERKLSMFVLTWG